MLYHERVQIASEAFSIPEYRAHSVCHFLKHKKSKQDKLSACKENKLTQHEMACYQFVYNDPLQTHNKTQYIF